MNIRTAEMKLIFSSSIVVSPPYEINIYLSDYISFKKCMALKIVFTIQNCFEKTILYKYFHNLKKKIIICPFHENVNYLKDKIQTNIK